MKNMYYGVFATNDFSSLNPILSFENDAKKKVSIIMFYQDWEQGYNESFNSTWMDMIRNHGSIPMITWEPYQPGLVDPTNQPKYSLSNIIAGNFDAYITKFAQDAKDWGHPFFLRFAHEMNGNGWYSWQEGYNGNTSGQYVKAWQHVFDIFTKVGATNIVRVWCPNSIATPFTPLPELYPGDSYVDWTGIDNYNWGNLESWSTWASFTDLFLPTYNQLLSIAPSKPQLVCETASTESGGNKSSWITDMLKSELINNFPKIYGFIWFNVNKETNWRIESSRKSKYAFASGISLSNYQSNNYRGISSITPILTP